MHQSKTKWVFPNMGNVGDDAFIVLKGRVNCGTMWASSPTTLWNLRDLTKHCYEL